MTLSSLAGAVRPHETILFQSLDYRIENLAVA
jgi:hypothetical protein